MSEHHVLPASSLEGAPESFTNDRSKNLVLVKDYIDGDLLSETSRKLQPNSGILSGYQYYFYQRRHG